MKKAEVNKINNNTEHEVKYRSFQVRQVKKDEFKVLF